MTGSVSNPFALLESLCDDTDPISGSDGSDHNSQIQRPNPANRSVPFQNVQGITARSGDTSDGFVAVHTRRKKGSKIKQKGKSQCDGNIECSDNIGPFKVENHTKPKQVQDQVRGNGRSPGNTHEEPPSITRPAVKSTVLASNGPRQCARKLPPQNLFDEPNARALAAWRAREPPSESYELPRNFDPRIQSREVPMFDYIAARTSTWIVVDITRAKNRAVAHIWGSNVEEAKKSIDSWIWQTFPSNNRKTKYPKIPSLSFEEWTAIEKNAEIERLKQSFRQAVPEGQPFAELVYVKLPALPWSLADVLGSNFEALDPIRTECLTFINYVRSSPDPNPCQSFQVLGNDPRGVTRACQRIKGIFSQQEARQLSRPQWWLIKPTVHVHTLELHPYQLPGVLATQRHIDRDILRATSKAVIPRSTETLSASGNFPKETILREGARELLKKAYEENVNALEAVVMTILSILKHYKGYVQMSARLGEGVLTAYPMENRKPKVRYNIREFGELLEDRNRENNELDGYITKELPDIGLDHRILMNMKKAKDVLVPCGYSSTSDMNTMFCATVIIADFARPDLFYQLELEYQEAETSCELVKKRWLRLEPNEHSLTALMDINILDLEGGLSHHLGITAASPVDDARLPKLYDEFVKDVTVLLDVAKDPTNPGCFFRWPLRVDGTSTIPVVRLQQKRAWRFSHRRTGYIVEVATLQDAEWEGGYPWAYDMRWGTSMWHPNWERLSANAQMGIGEEAPWPAKEWFFFPNPGPTSQPGPKPRRGRTGIAVPTEEAEDDEVESMFFHAGDGFRAFTETLACAEDVILGRHHEGEQKRGAERGRDDASPVRYQDTGSDDESGDDSE